MLLVALPGPSCTRRPIDEPELRASLERFESSLEGQPREAVQELLRAQARQLMGRVVKVQRGVVASPYVRENASNIYFGVGYDPADHLYLRVINPPLHRTLEHHRTWVSVVTTSAARQLSYELPVDEATFALMVPGQEVAFSCRIAALIRGRSVYCVPIELRAREPG